MFPVFGEISRKLPYWGKVNQGERGITPRSQKIAEVGRGHGKIADSFVVFTHVKGLKKKCLNTCRGLEFLKF
jgi:hypothetical protein